MILRDLIEELETIREEHGEYVTVMVSLTQTYSNMAFDLNEIKLTECLEPDDIEHNYLCTNKDELDGYDSCIEAGINSDEFCENCTYVQQCINERETTVWLTTSAYSPSHRGPYSPL